MILSTPTGSGKSLVALGAHFAALPRGRRSYYTAPIKALVSEKFFALCDDVRRRQRRDDDRRRERQPDAPIICCTAEVLANMALRARRGGRRRRVVMDEFHYYAEPDRGWAWQVPLLELPYAQFLLMSATLGDVTRFEEDLTRRTGRATVAVVSAASGRCRCTTRYVSTPLHETIEELLATKRAPVYVVHFTQASAVERAQALMSVNVCTREEKAAIAELIGGFRFTTGFGQTLSRLVRHGIGVHHAGMLPKYRRLVELLAQAGYLKVICGTDTLGVGINVPIRTVLFTALTKYDGDRRPGTSGPASSTRSPAAPDAPVSTPPARRRPGSRPRRREQQALAKAGDDPKKRRKVVRKKPPEGFVSWGEPTFERLVAAEPETLTSSLRVTPRDGAQRARPAGRRFRGDARSCSTTTTSRDAPQQPLIRRAIAIYRALLAAGVVERLDGARRPGRTVRLTVDLQPDFALNQPLSPFALAAFELLDRESPTLRARRRVGGRGDPRQPAAGARRRSAARPAARRSPR